MEFAAKFVDRSGPDFSEKVRHKFRGYFITVVPNVIKRHDADDYQQFRDWFFYHTRRLFSKEVMQQCIEKQDTVDCPIRWDDVVVVANVSFEHGDVMQKLHSHCELIIKIPTGKGEAWNHGKNKVSLSYKKFNDVARQIYGMQSIKVHIEVMNVSSYNVRDYLMKASKNAMGRIAMVDDPAPDTGAIDRFVR